MTDCNRRVWVRLLIKAPSNMPNNAQELFEYYCAQKRLDTSPQPWRCHCCNLKKSNMAAAFVVDAYGEDRDLYLTFICLDCLKGRINEPDNPVVFQALYGDLLFISKYEPSADFTDLSITEP